MMQSLVILSQDYSRSRKGDNAPAFSAFSIYAYRDGELF